MKIHHIYETGTDESETPHGIPMTRWREEKLCPQKLSDIHAITNINSRFRVLVLLIKPYKLLRD